MNPKEWKKERKKETKQNQTMFVWMAYWCVSFFSLFFFVIFILIADNISISMYIMCVILCLFIIIKSRKAAQCCLTLPWPNRAALWLCQPQSHPQPFDWPLPSSCRTFWSHTHRPKSPPFFHASGCLWIPPAKWNTCPGTLQARQGTLS